jgi:molybdate transport system permease protein
VIGHELFDIVARTLRVALVATLTSLPFAIALGYTLARRRFPGRTLVQALVALPMVLPPVAIGLGLLVLLGSLGGGIVFT